MASKKNFNTPDDNLIWRHLDDRLTPEEFVAFEHRLGEDAAFRERYVLLADLEASLRDECPLDHHIPSPLPVSPLRKYGMGLTGIAVCLSLLLIVLLLIRKNDLLEKQITEVPVSGGPDAPESELSPLTSHYSVLVPTAKDAAVLVRVTGSLRDQCPPGYRFKPGTLKLLDGTAQIEFMSGASVSLVGPAELQIDSKDEAALISGQLTARVPDRGRGFVLNAPSAAVFDLGTEFGIRVDETGVPEIGVRDGAVELSLLGEDGNTLVSQRMGEHEVVRVDPVKRKLMNLDSSSVSFPALAETSEEPLKVSDDYVTAILDDSPVIYWRFEAEGAKEVPNEVDAIFNGKLTGCDEDVDCLQLKNGYAYFQESEFKRYIQSDRAIPSLAQKGYTIEFWIRPNDLHHSTCVGIIPESDETGWTHLNVIEFASESIFIHDPGAFRYLHRSPPAKSVSLGVNAFSRGVCSPEQWQHIVAVTNENSLELYHNGELARRVEIENPECDGDFQVILGQLNLYQTVRQFSGAIDEFAIYRRPLSAEEIRSHFDLITSENRVHSLVTQ